MFGHLHHGRVEIEGVSIVTGGSAEVSEFIAGGALVAGQVVRFETVTATGELRSRTVVQGSNDGLAVGVALEAAAAAGDTVRVAMSGYAEDVVSNGVINAGDVVYAAASGAVSATPAGAPLGVALEAASGSTVDMYLYRRM